MFPTISLVGKLVVKFVEIIDLNEQPVFFFLHNEVNTPLSLSYLFPFLFAESDVYLGGRVGI